MHDVSQLLLQMTGNQFVFKQGFSLKKYNNNTIDNKEVHIYKHYKSIKCLNNEHSKCSRSDF